MNASDWVVPLGYVARQYGLSVSEQSALTAADWSSAAPFAQTMDLVGRRLGLNVRIVPPEKLRLDAWQLPLLCQLDDGTVAVITALSTDGQVSLLPGGAVDPVTLPAETLTQRASFYLTARPRRTLADARIASYIAPYQEGWLRRLALPDLRPYGNVMIASLTANLLGLTGILFSQQVYDRVVPAQSFNTLYVLFIGILLAAAFDFVLRRMRTQITDALGKRADMRLSDHVFGHALRVRSSARPPSTGAFVAQLRDLESLREALTSSTVTLLADLPFFFLFLAFFWYIGGAMALVPLAAVVLMLAPGLLLRKRLQRLLNEGMREGAMRNALLIEVAQAVDDIKCLQAEERFQHRWNHFNAVTAEAQLKQRRLTTGLSTWAQVVQGLTFATIVFAGAPMVIAGDMTTGTLVACSLLGSRMMTPMSQVSQLVTRLQQARLSYDSVDSLLRLPVDHPDAESRIGVAALQGGYELHGAKYFHDAEKRHLALRITQLSIQPGEKIAVLGSIGAGKSTLLTALAGLLEPAEGEALIDGMRIAQVDPADLRRDVGLLSQDSRLFHGTLRDNLTLGAPQASDAAIFAALKLVGAQGFVSRLAQGLDYPLLEGGRGLSGGQRQALMLARLVLRNPRVVLLDEPTASMDEQSERTLLTSLRSWTADRTLIVATHRMKVLELVDRILVMSRGQIVFDGSREAFLTRSSAGKAAGPKPVASAASTAEPQRSTPGPRAAGAAGDAA